jgi:hypothetical protein
MSAMQSIMQQYQKMSRAMQWATLAALGLALYFMWDNAIRPVTDDLNDDADVIARDVSELRSIETESQRLKDFKSPVVWNIGPVRPPAAVAEGSKKFNDVVLEVLQKHGATNTNFSSRPRGKLPRSALVSYANNGRIDRLTGDIKFDASPEKAAAIIAELESSPDIEAITSLRLVRDTGRKVRVTLTVETWVLATDATGGVA